MFVFLLTSLVAIAINYDSHKARQVEDYRVVCNYGSKTNFLAREDEGIYLVYYNLRNGLANIPDHVKESLQAACGITEAELKGVFDAVLYDPTNPSPALFTITEEHFTRGGLAEVAGYSFLSVFVIALVFEIMRRIFYYIALGSLRPAK